jgi:hypothetical protein
MIQNLLLNGINDDTIAETFQKITQENSKLVKSNHKLLKERDVALFKLEKSNFEKALNPLIPKSEDVRSRTKSKLFFTISY